MHLTHPQEIERQASIKKDTIEILKDVKAFCAVEEDHVGDEAGHNGYGDNLYNPIFYAFKYAVDSHLKQEKAAVKSLEDEAKKVALLKTMKKFNKDLLLNVTELEDEVNDDAENESGEEENDME